jgi:hypothetical protein
MNPRGVITTTIMATVSVTKFFRFFRDINRRHMTAAQRRMRPSRFACADADLEKANRDFCVDVHRRQDQQRRDHITR